MPAMIAQGLRNFADRTSDRSWVRSPISAMAIVEKAIRNTFMDCPGPSDDDNGSSPDGRRRQDRTVGLANALKAPTRHGVAAKYVDARPGQAGRLLPNGRGWLAWANTGRQLESERTF